MLGKTGRPWNILVVVLISPFVVHACAPDKVDKVQAELKKAFTMMNLNWKRVSRDDKTVSLVPTRKPSYRKNLSLSRTRSKGLWKVIQ